MVCNLEKSIPVRMDASATKQRRCPNSDVQLYSDCSIFLLITDGKMVMWVYCVNLT